MNRQLQTVLLQLQPPASVSSSLEIARVDHRILFQIKPLPMKGIAIWVVLLSTLSCLGLIAFFSLSLPWILVLTLCVMAASGGFWQILGFLNDRHQTLGPYAIIENESLLTEDHRIPLQEIEQVYEVYCKSRRGHSPYNYYRILFIEAGGVYVPIAWQLVTSAREYPRLKPRTLEFEKILNRSVQRLDLSQIPL